MSDVTTAPVTTAMVLAAGLGTRMRPLTNTRPKPLVQVAGKTLLDHTLDRLVDAGVESAVVNAHYLADQIEAHVARRANPRIAVSDERTALLETGGAIVKALPMLGETPFFVCNTDQVWTERNGSALAALAAAFDPRTMDVMMLLAPRDDCLGFHGGGDFFRDEAGRLTPRGEKTAAPWVYAGAYILHPRVLQGLVAAPFSAWKFWTPLFAAGRFHGLSLDGYWMHVGDPDARDAAEARLLSRAP
jgi:N-acetyl-alpha-D-muramate 1-phosphate uridylyltransferase